MRANLGMGFDSISALQRDGRFLNISHPVLDPAQTIQNVGIIRRALDGFLNQLLRLVQLQAAARSTGSAAFPSARNVDFFPRPLRSRKSALARRARFCMPAQDALPLPY